VPFGHVRPTAYELKLESEEEDQNSYTTGWDVSDFDEFLGIFPRNSVVTFWAIRPNIDIQAELALALDQFGASIRYA
jgi:hypothetical protein